MKRVHSQDTSPELNVRRIVHGLGFRYRLHVRELPGCPDLVFPTRRKIIFVHGCFWHQHGCEASALPASNQEYWEKKLSRNAERDHRILSQLRREGWSVSIVWECQIRNAASLTRRLVRFLSKGKCEPRP